MDLSRKRIIFVTSTSCVFLLEQSSYLFCCTPLLPLTLGGAPPLHPLCTPFAPPLHPYHRCCTPRLWRCTPLAPPRTLTGVGLWNITDVLEFPSTLMEQRTLDARGVLSYMSSLHLKMDGMVIIVISADERDYSLISLMAFS